MVVDSKSTVFSRKTLQFVACRQQAGVMSSIYDFYASTLHEISYTNLQTAGHELGTDVFVFSFFFEK